MEQSNANMTMYQKVTNSLFYKGNDIYNEECNITDFFNQKLFFNNTIKVKIKIINRIKEELYLK